MTEIKAGCIEEEGKVGVKLERARRAALTLWGGVSARSRGRSRHAGEESKDPLCARNKKKGWELNVKRVWMGVTEIIIHF